MVNIFICKCRKVVKKYNYKSIQNISKLNKTMYIYILTRCGTKTAYKLSTSHKMLSMQVLTIHDITHLENDRHK